MHPKCEKANRAASFVLRIWWEEGGAKPIWRGRVQPRHLFFIVALALGVATAPPRARSDRNPQRSRRCG
jgi:hypothetical protein